jgi:tetratricopeptide (TPR) repeat protein
MRASSTLTLDSLYTGDLTQEGAVLGTIGFIAPEHVFAGEGDARSDQFAFAVTMYLSLYGKHPFAYDDLASYVCALARDPAPPPAPSPVPRWIHAVIVRGLKREPDERFASMREMLAALDRNPSNRRRAWWVGAGLAAACLLAGGARLEHRARLQARCEAGGAIMAATWSDPVRQRVRAALAAASDGDATQVAARVEERIVQYAESWTATHRRISEATVLSGAQSAEAMETRLQCLERGRQELAALTDVLSHADAAVVDHALDAAYRLPPPTSCVKADSAAAAMPMAAAIRERVLTAGRAVAQASALGKAGEDRKAVDIVERVLPEVRAIPYHRAEGELLLIEGACKQKMGDNAGAVVADEDAFTAAQLAADDATAARAAAHAAFVLAAWLWKPEEARQWVAIAEAIGERVGHDDAVDADVLHSRIVVTAVLGHPEQTLGMQDREIAALERLYGEHDPRVATATMNKGVSLSATGRPDLAEQAVRRSIELLEAIAGPTNPHLDLYYGNLANTVGTQGHFAEAKSLLDHALALQGERPGATTLMILGSIAALDNRMDRPDAAMDAVEKGMALADRIGEAKWVPHLLVARARARLKKADATGAAADCARVLSMQEARGALVPDVLYAPDALTCLGEAEIALRNVDGAIAYLERSVVLEHRPTLADLAAARFALARALLVRSQSRAQEDEHERRVRGREGVREKGREWIRSGVGSLALGAQMVGGVGRDAERARDLARRALDDLRRLPGRESEAAEIEKWLDGR